MAKVGSLEEEKVLAVEIRKLRKKLRQIENLEVLDRPLNSEEQEKVNLIDRKSATCPFIQLARPGDKFDSPNKMFCSQLIKALSALLHDLGMGYSV